MKINETVQNCIEIKLEEASDKAESLYGNLEQNSFD